MKHSIIFTNTDNKWDNALPLGNGCFGAMVYYEKGKMYMNMNHYEVYYNIRQNVLPEDMNKVYKSYYPVGYIHERAEELAALNRPKGDEPYCSYRTIRTTEEETPESLKEAHKAIKPSYGVGLFSGSYPATGNLEYNFCSCLKEAEQSLILYTEDAKTELTLQKGTDKVTVETIVTRQDCIINRVVQTKQGLMPSFSLEFPPYRDLTYPDIEYVQVDDSTFAYTVKRMLGEKLFEFSGIVRLSGAKGKMRVRDYGADIDITESGEEFFIMTSVFTDWRYKDTFGEGLSVCDGFENDIENLYKEHKEYWDEFFNRSSISLPDKFLEHVYYINQYALDCSSGKDGIMKHHACGLNGLWDIKHPNLWGSMWYWDVNIQAAFAGVFSSNRLELAKVFSDGLRTYIDLARNQARDIHNVPGIAGDYPYRFYYSCWPWCAQYLWFLYEYSLDKEYLKNDAYPLFLGLCEFFVNIFKYDEERGYYSIYPDISPEQGPLAHDTVITVSCVKYLFKFTLEAAEILGETSPILDKCREMMDNLAPYPLIKGESLYGVHFRDSHDAPDNIWIRHPSLLMPLFPIGEFDLNSDEETLKILSNTIDYLEDRAEIGIFTGSWIAAGAARLGRGQTAYRLLYERGIDHMLRTNGLTAEETERFMNHCLVCRQPLYYPCMMEFTGEMLAALNEMLIQSHNGIIRVFPAMPDGDPEYYRMHLYGYAVGTYKHRTAIYDAWKNVRFDKLLAKGAFEVTSQLKDGFVEFVLINSKCGGKVNVTSPHITDDLRVFCDGCEIEYTVENSIYSFDTEAGKEYIIAKSADVCTTPCEDNDYHNEVLSRETYTKRHIYLGENAEAKYQKALDGFVRDWYLGNLRMENHSVYKFDFTETEDKNYDECLFRQMYVADTHMLGSIGFKTLCDDKLQFNVYQGFGFDNSAKVKVTKRNGPDLLRCDFAEGTEEVEFVIEAPRGQYEFFVVSGDRDEETVTCLEAVNGRRAGGEVIKKGEYQCKVLPLINEDDELIRLKISTKQGYKWKINYIILNSVKGY